METSLSRLATFLHWPVGGFYPSVLADDGFYYTGQGDEVKCFSCEIVLGNWQLDDNPNERHRQASPNCAIVTTHSCGTAIRNDQFNNNMPNVPFNSERSSGISTESSRSSFSQEASGGEFQSSSSPSSSDETELIPVDDSLSLKSELTRLSSFAKWPKTDIVKPELLAKEGFFYGGLGDRVECAFCEGALEKWETGDDPVREHSRNFCNCPFVKGLDVGNVPIGQSDLRSRRSGVRKAPARNESRKSKVKDDESRAAAVEGKSSNFEEQDDNFHCCTICLVQPVNVAFVPCGHVCACVTCAGKISSCPLCRKIITNRIRIYLS